MTNRRALPPIIDRGNGTGFRETIFIALPHLCRVGEVVRGKWVRISYEWGLSALPQTWWATFWMRPNILIFKMHEEFISLEVAERRGIPIA